MIVIAGGSGPFGRLVVQHLLRRLPASEIAVTAPDPRKAADLADLGITVRPEDFGDPEKAAAAVRGADQVLIVAPSGRTGDGLTRAQARACVDAAAAAGAAGAKHIAYTSIINAGGTHHLQHLVVEGRIVESGVPFTFLRNNLISEALLPAARLALGSGEFVCAMSDTDLIAPAARTDYAEIAAHVLTEDVHRNARLELSGPLGLKPLGIASVFAEIADKDIAVRAVDPADLATELTGMGASEQVVAELGDLYHDASNGEWALATDTLEQLLTHPRVTLVEALRAALGR